MADIPQWRRKVPGGRPRALAVTANNDDGDIETAPGMSTPKKRIKPKLSSYFTGNNPGPSSSLLTEAQDAALDLTLPELPSWPVADPFPDPDPDSLVESVMIQLMNSPLSSLDPKYNNVLMRIFECYRHLKDELAEARSRLDKERDRSYGITLDMNAAEQHWEEEKALYKEEVRRLEIIISKSNRGLAGVTMARQESVLRRKQKERADDEAEARTNRKETVLEFLEGTKIFDDRGYSSQRGKQHSLQPSRNLNTNITAATMRTVPRSPSHLMKKLSRKLTKKASSTHVHQDLPFGTPPRFQPSTIAEASMLDEQAEMVKAKRVRSGSNAVSEANTEASVSTFSGAGDMLPDELEASQSDGSPEQDPDVVAIKCIATTLSNRRGISADAVLPKLFELFREQEDRKISDRQGNKRAEQAEECTLTFIEQAPAISPTPTRRKGSAHTLGSGSFMTKASGFFHKLRPQLHADTVARDAPAMSRRFSFEFGDDIAAIDAPFSTEPGNVDSDHALRKSVSLPALGERAQQLPMPEPVLSPVLPSPTDNSPSSASRRASRIPSPAYVPSLARPRQDREDSTSSLVTVVKHSERASRRTGSVSSSRYSRSGSMTMSPSDAHSNRTSHASHGQESSKRSSEHSHQSHSGNWLLDHTNKLRSPSATIAAAKAVASTTTRHSGSSEESKVGHKGHARRSSNPAHSRPESTSPFVSIGNNRAKENARPGSDRPAGRFE